MAKRWEDDYSQDIVNQVKNRNYATGGADAQLMSDEDYAKVLDARSRYDSADDAGKAALHDSIEQLRSGYNYSGGDAGNEYIKLPEKFTYESAPQYISQYQDLIDAAYARIANREPFEYDYTQDPRWQSYKKQYTREGVRSQEDTMGQYAAMTGGIPSSAAVTAASQARDYYNAKMTDKIPELYQAAYDMYLAEDNRDRQNLAQLINLENLGRDAYNTQLGQYNNDRSFGFNVWNAAQDRERQAARDAIADQQWYANYAYNAKGDAQNSVLKMISAGINPNNIPPELLEAAGYTADMLSGMYGDLYSPSYGGGGGYGGGYGGYNGTPAPAQTPEYNPMTDNDVANSFGMQLTVPYIRSLVDSGDLDTAGRLIETGRAGGYINDAEYDELYSIVNDRRNISGSGWNPWQMSGGSGSLPVMGASEDIYGDTTYYDYNSAVDYLKQAGASSNGLMTKAEWNKRKTGYNSNGKGSAEVRNYNSYEEYLDDFVRYQLTNR